MLRLDAPLPIIAATPVQDQQAGRRSYRQPGNDKGVDSGDAAGRPIPEPELQSALERDLDPLLGSARLPVPDASQGSAANIGSGPQPRLPTGQPAKRATLGSYGIIDLLNPALDESQQPASAETRISQTASLLASLINENPQSEESGTIQTAAPLFSEPPSNPATLAVALRNAIGLSGLFYESHLGQWLNGTRALESLKQEPQGRLPTLLAFSPADLSAGNAENAQPSIVQGPLTWLQQNLVQQLSILNNPVLVWTGQPWPGQQVSLQTRRGRQECVDSEAPWVTRLSLEMPRLGKLDVVITLDSAGVDIDVRSDNANAESRLQNHQIALGNRLSDMGCRVKRMNIRKANGQG
jgi:Flagellar hook-length control protein FliK